MFLQLFAILLQAVFLLDELPMRQPVDVHLPLDPARLWAVLSLSSQSSRVSPQTKSISLWVMAFGTKEAGDFSRSF